ncbi:hypothetical protein AQV86_02115 [Nanohaloarchaea archaeon SG9]|nr:hypothetical protein AQV86_02115 [Nanohaloarchaea archaeon SG9]
MGLEDFSESDIEDYAHEARIRGNLDDFFMLDQSPDLHGVNRRAEGMEAPKTFARQVASRATEFAEQEDVFILLGEEDGNLNVVAYDDGEVGMRKESGHWDVYRDILRADELRPGMEPEKTVEMPDVFQTDVYSLDLAPTSQRYVKTRNGGVIGPYTEDFHNEYGDFEQEQDHWTKI